MTKFSIKEWQDKHFNEGAKHPKAPHFSKLVRVRDFKTFANSITDDGWEFKNFPKKFKSLLDKKAEDGEIAYDQLTGVENYQDSEEFAVHYVTNGQEDWYLLVNMDGKAEAVKNTPKFKTI